jgi:DNA-binding NarL/FixJ family response regulator
MPIHFLLADDYPLVLEWLRIVLEAKGYVVDGEATNGRDAVTLALHFRPDIVLMDLHMPMWNGIRAAREILRNLPNTAVIILTTAAADSDVSEGLEIGIRGFVTKTGHAEDVLHAINEVLAGKVHLGRQFSTYDEKPEGPAN